MSNFQDQKLNISNKLYLFFMFTKFKFIFILYFNNNFLNLQKYHIVPIYIIFVLHGTIPILKFNQNKRIYWFMILIKKTGIARIRNTPI